MKRRPRLRQALAATALTLSTAGLTALAADHTAPPPDTAWGSHATDNDTAWGTPPDDGPEDGAAPVTPFDTAWG